MIAILILTTGLIGTAAAITYALQFGASQPQCIECQISYCRDDLKRSKLCETAGGSILNKSQMSEVLTIPARQILLTDLVSDLNRFRSVPVPNAVNGTDDDIRDPGVDGIFGTADDFDNQGLVRSGYMRKITITGLKRYFEKGGSQNSVCRKRRHDWRNYRS